MSNSKTTSWAALGTAVGFFLIAADDSHAQSLPTRRAGLWKSETFGLDKKASDKEDVMRAQMCVDAATDRKLMEHSLAKDSSSECSAPTFKREGAAHVVEMTCKAPKGSSLHRTVFTGDFNSRIQAVTTTKQTPPDPEASSLVLRQLSTLVSAQCPEGWKPGDIQMEGMPKMNAHSMMDLADGLLKGVEKLFGK
jgi:hypothetical protein